MLREGVNRQWELGGRTRAGGVFEEEGSKHNVVVGELLDNYQQLTDDRTCRDLFSR